MRAAWPGFDLVTFDSGGNPLLDSYAGAPTTVRGTDDAGWGRQVLALWNAQASDAGNGVTGSTPATPVSFGIPGADSVKRLGVGAAGAVLALLIVTVGLLILWKG